LKYRLEQLVSDGDSSKDIEEAKLALCWGLIHSDDKQNILQGLGLLDDLEKSQFSSSELDYIRALGEHRLGHFTQSLAYLNKLLQDDPCNTQYLDLKKKNQNDLKKGIVRPSIYWCKDGIIGMALVGGVAAAAVGLAMALFRKSSSHQ
jgi:hypothetical protein